MKKRSVYLGAGQYRELENIAGKTGLTVADLLKRAVAMYVEKRRVTDPYVKKIQNVSSQQ
ncbi:MAG: ribbon-helix-helix protein, CopG family [Candidatus Syntrophoarchaeum sp.]|nr:ribbon-helix-helix protein, CopG family [Candidatus Syntrophoarchaeum sp.]